MNYKQNATQNCIMKFNIKEYTIRCPFSQTNKKKMSQNSIWCKYNPTMAYAMTLLKDSIKAKCIFLISP